MNRYPARGGRAALSNYRADEDDRARAEAHKKRGPMQHELKTDPAVFEANTRGLKTHEIRNNDRWFKEGDTLLLRETRYTGQQMSSEGKPLEYTGRELTRRVGHIQTGYGLKPGWVILSFAMTPAAWWSANGEPDPHDAHYTGERASLALGQYTDDELANAVFLHGDANPPMDDVIAGRARRPIVYLTAAKERIRWLSRALEAARAELPMERVLALFRANCVNYSGNYEVTPGQAQRIASELRKLPATE